VDMAIFSFSFFLEASCVQLLFSFFTWTFMCPYFFYSHVSFAILTWRERYQHIAWSFILWNR
jgi:hypothetical protein